MWARGCAVFCALASAACGARDDPSEGAPGRPLVLASSLFRSGASPTQSYAGTADTSIYAGTPDANLGALGSCAAGRSELGSDAACLLRWELDGVPEDALLESAIITLQVVNGGGGTYGVHALTRSFDEARATWQRASGEEAWESPGASGESDLGPLLASLSGEPGPQRVVLDAEGVRLVQGWVRGERNDGLIIVGSDGEGGIDVAPSEASIIAYRPALELSYRTAAVTAESADGSAHLDEFVLASAGDEAPKSGADTASGVLIAFIGDQGNNDNSTRVLELIAQEGADAVMHNGDFDYVNSPAIWEARINAVLGENYPYFAVAGNHDAQMWDGPGGYAELIAARHARVPEMTDCTGELGVRAVCRFRGVSLVESCVGTHELRSDCAADSPDQLAFLREALAAAGTPFSVCNWHKNQRDMQVGSKQDEVGWGAYRECMRAGAMIATGHEHSYARTLALRALGHAAAGHGPGGSPERIELEPGSTFVFVSGLAGKATRDFDVAEHEQDTWWASYYARNRWLKNGVLMPGVSTHGALFIEFGARSNPRFARAYFKDVNGRVTDDFTIQVAER